METSSKGVGSSLESGKLSPGLIRKKQRMDGQRICRVCGDKAVAHNFDVISCESCKTFFRRNAFKPQKECAFGSQCEITINTRRFCTVCRLKKCLDIGMKTDMILDKAERKARMDKITENRKKRQMEMDAAGRKSGDNVRSNNSRSSSTTSSSCRVSNSSSGDGCARKSCTQVPECGSSTLDPEVDFLDTGLIEQGVNISDADSFFVDLLDGDDTAFCNGALDQSTQCEIIQGPEQCQSSNGSVSQNDDTSSVELFILPVAPNTMTFVPVGTVSNTPVVVSSFNTLSEGIVSSTQGCKPSCEPTSSNGVPQVRIRSSSFERVPEALLPSDSLMYWQLSDEEQTLLSRLTEDYKETVLHLPTLLVGLELTLENLCLNDTINIGERYTADLVKFFKHLPDFRFFDMNDQIAALKGGTLRCQLLRSAACFCIERDAWIKEIGEMPVSVFAKMTKHEEMTEHYADFCRSLQRILGDDYTAYMLLSLIVIFEPKADGMVDRQTANRMHDKYSILLKHHFEARYSYLFASQFLEAVYDSLNESKALVENLVSVFPSWMGMLAPLQAEIMKMP